MKFNKKATNKTENFAGGQAYATSVKLEFVFILLTSFMKDQFYRSEEKTISRLRELIKKINDFEFVGKAAIYARTKFGMRFVTHVVAGELAKRARGLTWTRDFFDKIVYRPDDMLKILSYYFLTEKKLSNPLRDGFARALTRFDEYTLAKYRGEGKKIKLVDVVNICHPKSTAAIDKLMRGTLKSFDTWETELTKAGQVSGSDAEKAELKSDAWKRLIEERKIGYFALLRNLRNIIEQAPEVLPEALVLLVDEEMINHSMVLPFRYLKAISEIEKLSGDGVREVLIALNEAIDLSLANVPKLQGKNLLVLDTSLSMEGRPLEIGSLLASAMYKTNDADFMSFSDQAKYISLNPADSTATIAARIRSLAEMCGTNFHSIFENANRAYDRIIIFSDMQGWIGNRAPTKAFNEYKERTKADPVVFSFDLQGYGTLQFPERNVYAIAGFSDKVFDIMKLLESDKQALLQEIEKIELG
ncbi:MAG TPA: TROVE domain-containing protein [Brevefilum sp.]|nr:TROVE domain-containing protein [Brevefilum sp.]HPL68894.1 TROVE domain-containing protein [Brevefilum sp.]